MEKKWMFLSAIILILFLAVPILIYTSLKSNIKSSPTNLEECKIIRDNGSNKINLLFFSDKKTAKIYSEFFLETSPFSKNKDEFNIYYIDTYSPECEIYQEQAILCNGKELTKKAASCPYDFVVAVIQPESPTLRSSAYHNIMSLNKAHQLTVLLHEFGHVFANLADEYVPANLPKNPKNCVNSCDKFPEEKDGCFSGCSKSELFRSIDNGVMRTLSSKNYGIFNENLIQELIGKHSDKITGFAISSSEDCSSKEYFLIEGVYTDGKIIIKDKTLEIGCAPKTTTGDFSYNILSQDEIISKGRFAPEFIFTDSQSSGESEIKGNVNEFAGTFYLAVPKVINANSVQILSPQNELLIEINIQELNSKPCRIK